MELLFLLILLGLLISYLLLKSSVGNITQTPVWLLWLVLMTPPMLWIAWVIFAQEKPSWFLLIGPFALCPLLYWWLIQLGRPAPKTKETDAELPKANSPETAKAQENSSKLRPITNSEETALRNCFPWGIYYLQQIDYRPQAILCLGKLRAVPEVAYKTIKENVEKVFGDRFLVVFQESFRGQPFFALVPNPWAKSQNQLPTELIARPALALGLLSITLITTTVIGVEISGIPPDQLQSDPALLIKGLPYSLGIIAILAVHELSHYLSALHHKIQTTLPYFIPFPDWLGTFGAFIQMRSPVPDRKALFDFAIAGPVGGMIVTLPILIWGLSLSEVVPISDESSLLSFEAFDPRFSLLVAVVGKLVLGNELMPGMAIHLHPAAVAGCIGLCWTALNLTPVGQLDGGRIVHAMFGQVNGAAISQVTRLLMLVLSINQRVFLLWAIILLFIPITDQPTLNDVTELDNRRDLCGLLSLALLASIFLPLPGAIAQWLNI